MIKVITSLILVGVVVFAGQFVYRYLQVPQPRVHATWAFNPQSVAEAKESSNKVVIGRVQRIQRADDILISAPGEPGDENRIPAEIVTVQLEKSCKGGKPERVQVFHTGPFEPAQEPKPKGPPDEPLDPDEAERANQARGQYLSEDPAYSRGQRVVLFLTNGPDTVTLNGQAVEMSAVLAPQGRYTVLDNGEVDPVTERGFAREFRGKKLQELEKAIGNCK